MIFEKKLLILTGDGGNGVLRIERKSSGTTCVLTGTCVGDCVLSLKDDKQFECYGAFSLDRPFVFALPGSMRLDALSAAVGTVTGGLALSGSFKRPVPWQSSYESDVRRALRALGITQFEQKKNIADFFYDIIPQEYDDSRLSEVNYYHSSLSALPPDGQNMPPPLFPVPPVTLPPHPKPDAKPPKPQPESEKASLREQIRRDSDEIIRAAEAELNRLRKERAAMAQPLTKSAPPPIPTAAPAPHASESSTAAFGGEASDIAATFSCELNSEPDYTSTAEKIPEMKRVSFYEKIQPQLKKLFERSERFTRLEEKLPESRWIKVDYDSKGRFYVVGLVGDPVRYICYGVLGSYSPTPPSELAGYCQWLADDDKNPSGKGYWVMYQDAINGNSIL